MEGGILPVKPGGICFKKAALLLQLLIELRSLDGEKRGK